MRPGSAVAASEHGRPQVASPRRHRARYPKDTRVDANPGMRRSVPHLLLGQPGLLGVVQIEH